MFSKLLSSALHDLDAIIVEVEIEYWKTCKITLKSN